MEKDDGDKLSGIYFVLAEACCQAATLTLSVCSLLAMEVALVVLVVREESKRASSLSLVCNQSTMVFIAAFSSGDEGKVWRGNRQSAMSRRAWCHGGEHEKLRLWQKP